MLDITGAPRVSRGLSSMICMGAACSIVLYILWMDIGLYHKLQNSDYETLTNPKPSSKDDQFTFVTIKLCFTDPLGMYWGYTSASWFEKATNLSKILPPNSANTISYSHLGVQVIASYFIMSSSLNYRRFGVLLFWFHTWLDSLDGIVARNQREQATLHTTKFSAGWIIDAVTDSLGGIILVFSLIYYHVKNPPKTPKAFVTLESLGPELYHLVIAKLARNGRKMSLTTNNSTSGYSPCPVRETHSDMDLEKSTKSSKSHSRNPSQASIGSDNVLLGAQETSIFRKFLFFFRGKWMIALRIAIVGIGFAISSSEWDAVQDRYARMLSRHQTDADIQARQLRIWHSSTFWVIAWFWRILNTHSIYNFLMFGIWFNRAWDFLTVIAFFVFPFTILWLVITEIHLAFVASFIALPA